MVKSNFFKLSFVWFIPLIQYSFFWIWMLIGSFFWEWSYGGIGASETNIFMFLLVTTLELFLHFWLFPFLIGVLGVSVLISAIASPLLLFNFCKNFQNADGILLVGSFITGVWALYMNPFTNAVSADLFESVIIVFYEIPAFFIWVADNILIIGALYFTPILWKFFSVKLANK